ncbi:hypothetical protein VTI74DRAFT_7748 [Chaetomium olivicolor]
MADLSTLGSPPQGFFAQNAVFTGRKDVKQSGRCTGTAALCRVELLPWWRHTEKSRSRIKWVPHTEVNSGPPPGPRNLLLVNHQRAESPWGVGCFSSRQTNTAGRGTPKNSISRESHMVYHNVIETTLIVADRVLAILSSSHKADAVTQCSRRQLRCLYPDADPNRVWPLMTAGLVSS